MAGLMERWQQAQDERDKGLMASEDGSRGYSWQNRDPTIREHAIQATNWLQELFGGDPGSAETGSQRFWGGPRSNLPWGMGVADLTPFGGPANVQQGLNEGSAAATRGDYGNLALSGLQVGGGILDMIPAGMILSRGVGGLMNKFPGGGAFRDDMAGAVSIPGIGDNVGPPMPDIYNLWGGGQLDEANSMRLGALAAEHPGMIEDLPFLTAEEAGRITKSNVGQYGRVSAGVDPEELVAAAAGGQAKKGWYKQSAKAIDTVFEDDAEQFTALLAALSPQTSVESNLQNATAVWKGWIQAGRPRDPEAIKAIMGQNVQGGKGMESVLGAWINNSVRALSADPERLGRIRLSGPKVDSFMANLIGDMDQVTNDAWMANLSGVPQDMFAKAGNDLPGFGPGYTATSAQTRRAAQLLSERSGVPITPAEIQEMGWSYGKALYEQRAAGGLMGPRTTEVAKSLSDDVVNAVPDFATLLQDPIYGKSLQDVGYEGRLQDAYAGRSVGGPGADLRKHADPAAGERVSGRLEQLYRTRQEVERTSPFRMVDGPAGGYESSRQPYSYAAGHRGRSRVGEGQGRLLEPNPEFTKALEPLGAKTPNIYEMGKDPASVDEFINAGKAAQTSRAGHGPSVDIYNRNGYKGHKLHLSDDKTSGFGISPDGEIVSVFNTNLGPNRGWASAAINQAVHSGGRWLNGFDTVLPQIYGKAGFKPVARIPFDEKILRADMGDEAADAFMKSSKRWNKGKPDLVFMAYDPTFKGKIMSGVGGKVAKSYDHAMELVQKEVARLEARTAKPPKKPEGGLMSGGSRSRGLMSSLPSGEN